MSESNGAPSGIGEALAKASAYLAAHPEEARYTDSIATARLGSGLRVVVVGSGAERVITDMPESVGGSGDGPSPGWLFRAALASCVATFAAMLLRSSASPQKVCASTSTASQMIAASWASTIRCRRVPCTSAFA